MTKKSTKKKTAPGKPKKTGAERAAHLSEHKFKPGQSGNPNGRPKTPPDLLAARNFSREELERAVLQIVWAKEDAVADVLLDPDAPMITRIVARLTTNAFVTGDVKTAAFLFDRAGFPVKRDDNPSIPALLAAMPLDQLIQLARQAMDVLATGEQDPLSGIVNITPEGSSS